MYIKIICLVLKYIYNNPLLEISNTIEINKNSHNYKQFSIVKKRKEKNTNISKIKPN